MRAFIETITRIRANPVGLPPGFQKSRFGRGQKRQGEFSEKSTLADMEDLLEFRDTQESHEQGIDPFTAGRVHRRKQIEELLDFSGVIERDVFQGAAPQRFLHELKEGACR